MQKAYFLYLIIYILFSSEVYSQSFKLKVIGNGKAETTTIDSLDYLQSHKDYASILLEIDSIQNTLYKTGYIENELKDIIRENDSSFIAKFHLKRKYNSIYIYYDSLVVETSILKLVSDHVFNNYFILPFNALEKSLIFINSKISEKGNPFSKLKLSNIKIDKNSLKANLIIDSEKEKRTIDKIIVKGYEKFPKSYLKHYLKITQNQTFNLNIIKQKTSLLNDLRFTDEIKPPEVLFSKDSTTLYIYTVKSKSNSFDGFLGFGTNEKTTKLEFDGYLNLNLINNLNYGELFSLLYKSDENDQKTFNVNLSLPYLFKLPIGIDLRLQIFKKDSTFTTVNQSVKLHYQINSKHKISGGIKSINSNNLLSSTNISENITDYKSKYYSFAYEFSKSQPNNLLFRINSKVYSEINLGSRKANQSNKKQLQYLVDAFKVFNLNNKNSLYLRVNGANLISDTYFENELFRFGGINSIRGFKENSLYANLFGVINSEYRYLLSSNIYIHTIIDLAYFENNILNTKEKLFGYGFGFGILTKAGVFKLNYANGKNENTKFKLSNSKIHISLTSDF